MTETEMSSSAGSTTTPFLCRLTTSRTVLPKVEEDADRPRCDSNLVYMPNDRQARFGSCLFDEPTANIINL